MLTRRRFLTALGLGAAAAAVPAVLAPERKLWFVPSNAPVGGRVELVVTGRMEPLIHADTRAKRARGEHQRHSYARDWDLLREPVDDMLHDIAQHPATTLADRLQLAEDMHREGLLTPEDLRRVLEAHPSQRRGIYGRGIVDELRDTQRDLDRTLADIARNLNSISDHPLVAITGPETDARGDRTRT
jgi:hypothetical protein